jgi:hypothetical protein
VAGQFETMWEGEVVGENRALTSVIAGDGGMIVGTPGI